jgi:hypothetical protein
VTVNSSQQATCTTSSLVSPADVIDATYSGDPNFTFTGTATITESVGKTGATTGLSSSLPTASVNQVVTFTAKVTAPTGKVVPTGSVIFTQGSTMLCSAVTLTVGTSSSTATCNYAFPAATATTGVTVTATFSGDSDFGPGTGGTVNQVVNADSNTTSVTSSPASPSVDQQVTFTAVVMPANTGTAVPAGTVAFSFNFDNFGNQCDCDLHCPGKHIYHTGDVHDHGSIFRKRQFHRYVGNRVDGRWQGRIHDDYCSGCRFGCWPVGDLYGNDPAVRPWLDDCSNTERDLQLYP